MLQEVVLVGSWLVAVGTASKVPFVRRGGFRAENGRRASPLSLVKRRAASHGKNFGKASESSLRLSLFMTSLALICLLRLLLLLFTIYLFLAAFHRPLNNACFTLLHIIVCGFIPLQE